jgi:succinate dehydrogenase / fumarate reductase iron-sulfur subunit
MGTEAEKILNTTFRGAEMKLTVKVRRFNPKVDREPYYQEYRVEADPMDRVLDLLMNIKRSQDGTLTFRKSCAHGVCGSDAMRINGRERLACKTLVKDVASGDGVTISVEPLGNLPVERDLMVRQSDFFEKYRSVKPFLISEQEFEEKERLQSPEQRAKFDDATKCILCAACYSACPVISEKNPDFLGPAAIVQAARFLDDNRDTGFEERLFSLDNKNGVWPCENHFQCTVVCPRSIKVTKLINLTKQKIKKYRKQRGEHIRDGSP